MEVPVKYMYYKSNIFYSNLVFQSTAFEIRGVFTVNINYLFRIISDGLSTFVRNRGSVVLYFVLL